MLRDGSRTGHIAAVPGGSAERYPGTMAAIVDERLALTFVELADTLVGGFDLMEFLHMLAERCVELLEVDAAGLLLADARGAVAGILPDTRRGSAMRHRVS